MELESSVKKKNKKKHKHKEKLESIKDKCEELSHISLSTRTNSENEQNISSEVSESCHINDDKVYSDIKDKLESKKTNILLEVEFEGEDLDITTGCKKKKKKKKEGKGSETCNLMMEDKIPSGITDNCQPSSTVINIAKKLKTKKSKKRKRDKCENADDFENTCTGYSFNTEYVSAVVEKENNDEIERNKKHKKKKRMKENETDTIKDTEKIVEIQEETDKISHNEKQAEVGESNSEVIEGIDWNVKRSKHKKKKKKERESDKDMVFDEQKHDPEKVVHVNDTDEGECAQKVSKLSKKKEKQQCDVEQNNDINKTSNIEVDHLYGFNQNSNASIIKKKKRKKDTETDDGEKEAQIDINKKMKMKNGHREVTEVQKISNGNETVIQTPNSISVGQWSSAELGDKDRQNKFFRLLGGFKKGNDTLQIKNKFGLGKKVGSNTFCKTGGSFAMNKRQEDAYSKALESDFDRAITMNMNKGIGLGFEKPPDAGKKFFIDTTASKSVKFDD